MATTTAAGTRMLGYLPPYYQTSRIMAALLDAGGAELDIAAETLADLQAQLFVMTATWALPIWEAEFGVANVPVTGETPEGALARRRGNVLAKILGVGTPTMRRVTEVALSFLPGGGVHIIQNHAGYALEIRLTSPGGIPPYSAQMLDALREIVPAHLAIALTSNVLIWDELDALTWDWDALDALTLTWDELEVYA